MTTSSRRTAQRLSASNTTNTGESQDNSQNEELPQTLEQRLGEARQWLQNEQAQAELNAIDELRNKQMQGESIEHLLLTRGASGSDNTSLALISNRMDAKLPEPPAPRVYHANSRQEYDEWVRECETYHRRASSRFPNELEKVEFGRQYLSRRQKQDWDGYAKDSENKLPTWKATWDLMKHFMLEQLGPAYEREQRAFDKIRKISQEGRDPLDILNTLRPLWAEAGLKDPQNQIQSFISCLDIEIYNKVMYEENRPCTTIREAEDRAIRAQRQRKDLPLNPKKRRPTEEPVESLQGSQPVTLETKTSLYRGKQPKRHYSDTQRRTTGQPSTNSRSVITTRSNLASGRDKPDWQKRREDNNKANIIQRKDIVCYECNTPGHIRPNCPKLQQSGKGRATNA
jgi:hypothetical protein